MTEAGRVTVSRIIAAPRRRVFRAFTDPALIANWWGGALSANPVCEFMEVRAGGGFRLIMKADSGKLYTIAGHYTEVIENERLAYRDTCACDGVIFHDAPLTATFEDADGGTRVTISSVLAPDSGRANPRTLDEMKDGWRAGWEGNFAGLAARGLADAEAASFDFTITRTFNAPRELVFQCWMEPERLKQWWGPHMATVPRCEIDPREGGAFSIDMAAGGAIVPFRGAFLEIDPPRRIVKRDDVSGHSEEWFDAVYPGRDRAMGKPDAGIICTLTFDDLGGGRTRLTARQRFTGPGHRDAFVRAGSAWGWGQSFDKLVNLLITEQAPADEIAVSRLIAAPRAMVFAAFLDRGSIGAWWGPDGFTTTTASMDARPGGQWIYTMHGPDGTDYPNRISYREIIPGECIAYDHDEGEGGDPAHGFRGKIRLADEAGGTRVTFQLTLASAARKAALVKFGAVQGGRQNLARLDAYLAAAG